jgi:hypothetical protein
MIKNMKEKKKCIGIIKWFNEIKGFGTLATANNHEYFIHKSNIEDIPEKILIATSFVFESITFRGRRTAIKCRIPKFKDDFKLGLELLGTNRTVNIEIVVHGKSKWGNPYTKKEIKGFDILSYYLYTVLKDKNKDEIVEYFKDAFNEKYSDWNIQELSDFFKITRNRINALKFDKEKIEIKIENEIETVEIEINQKLIKELIDYYCSKLNSELIVNLWKEGELSSPINILNKKERLLFDENYLVTHIDLLDLSDFKNIYNYEISKNILSKIIDSFFSKEINNINTLQEIINTVNIYHIEDVFDKIVANISPELMFNIWHKRSIFIDYGRKCLSLYFSSSSDFKISEEILYKECNYLDYNSMKRMKKIYDESILFCILKEKINKKQINDENIVDNFNSIKLLETEHQNDIIKLLQANLSDNQIDLLIQEDFLSISDNKQVWLLQFKSEIGNEAVERYQNIILKNENIKLEKKIELLKQIDLDFFISYFKNNCKQYSDSEKLQFLQSCNKFEIFETICEEWLFEGDYSTLNIIKIGYNNNFNIASPFWLQLSDKIGILTNKNKIEIIKYFPHDFIINSAIETLNFNSPDDVKTLFNLIAPANKYEEAINIVYRQQKENLSVNLFVDVFNIFQDNEISYDISDFSVALNKPVVIDELKTLIQYQQTIKKPQAHILQEILISYLDTYIIDNDDIFLEIIPLINDKFVLSTVIKKCHNIANTSLYLSHLIKHNSIRNVAEELIKDHLLNYIKKNPIEIIEFTSIHFNNLYQFFTDRIKLDRYIFVNFYHFLLNNIERIKPLIKEINDINILVLSYSEPLNISNIEKINHLFRKYDYAFQSDYIKFNAFLYRKKILSETDFKTILSSCEFVELSALLIKSFILNKTNSADTLMSMMNGILKQHFNLLSNEKITESTYNNIFSIRNLVKRCSGRKKYSGFSKYYSDDIYGYCEGRFWKSDDARRPLYWCRNDVCTSINDKVEFEKNFENWTLVELNELFDIKLDRLVFTHLAGWLNRMQTIFDKLKCKDCGNYLRPKSYIPSSLGYYAVPLFICVNKNCVSFNKNIRFTHCRGCGKILDSRECKTCNSCNWLICDDEKCKKCGCGANYNPVYAEYQ